MNAQEHAAACDICGSAHFEPAYGGRLGVNGHPPKCAACGSLERHRVVSAVYKALATFTASRSALHFSPDISVVPKQFRSYRGSTQGSENALDMYKTGLPAGSFDMVISNHVLELLKDDVAAMRESIRVVGPKGIVHVCVPSPTAVSLTKDWGFADKTKGYHYRVYGADIGKKFCRAITGLEGMVAIGRDRITEAYEAIFFFSLAAGSLESMAPHLLNNGIPAIYLGR